MTTEITTTCINPGCDDETDHLSINIKKGVFHCWKCDWGGKIVNNKDVLNLLKTIKPIKVIKKPENSGSLINTKEFIKLTDLSDEHQAIKYLKNRGVTIDSCVKLQGYYTQTGLLSGRIVFPVKVNNTIVGWQGRTVFDKTPKYLTYGKKNLGVFSLKSLNKYENFIILFEGVFDILKIPDYGIAILGKRISKEQIRIFTAFLNVKTIFVMLDSDAKEDTLKICNTLSEYFNMIPILIDSGDPGDLTQTEILELCKRSVNDKY
jgi:5S rRNA maturation endonuclease (ribonuclease M5)